MAIVSSGQVSLNDIQTEFGGSNPIALSEYYGKGNAPASGEIQIASDFYGTSSGSASVHKITVSRPASATALGFRFDNRDYIDISGDDAILFCSSASHLFTANTGSNFSHQGYMWKLNLANGNQDWAKKVNGPGGQNSNNYGFAQAKIVGNNVHWFGRLTDTKAFHYVLNVTNGATNSSAQLTPSGNLALIGQGPVKNSENELIQHFTHRASNSATGYFSSYKYTNSTTPSSKRTTTLNGLQTINAEDNVTKRVSPYLGNYLIPWRNSSNNSSKYHSMFNAYNGEINAHQAHNKLANANGHPYAIGDGLFDISGHCANYAGWGNYSNINNANIMRTLTSVGNSWRNTIRTFYTLLFDHQNCSFDSQWKNRLNNTTNEYTYGPYDTTSGGSPGYYTTPSGKILLGGCSGTDFEPPGNYISGYDTNQFAPVYKYSANKAIEGRYVLASNEQKAAGQVQFTNYLDTKYYSTYPATIQLSGAFDFVFYIVKWNGGMEFPTGSFTNSGLTISYTTNRNSFYGSKGNNRDNPGVNIANNTNNVTSASNNSHTINMASVSGTTFANQNTYNANVTNDDAT